MLRNGKLPIPFLLSLATTALLWLLPATLLAQPLRVGLSLPLSGAASERGVPIRNAIELYLEGVNAKGGIAGRKLELLVQDDKNEPKRAAKVAKDLAEDSGVLAMIGTYYPDAALAAAKALSDANMVSIFPTVGAPEVLQASPWMFSASFEDSAQAEFIAVYIKHVLKRDRVLLLHNTDTFGTGMKRAFLEKANRLDLAIVKVLPVELTSIPENFVSELLPDAKERASIGAVVAFTHSGPGIKVLPKLREAGIGVPIMAPSTWTNRAFFSDVEEKYTKDVFVTAPFLQEIANEEANRFLRTYEKRYGEVPPGHAALGYDAIHLVAKALEAQLSEKSEEPTREGIRNYFATLTREQGVVGVTGELFFRSSRSEARPYVQKF